MFRSFTTDYMRGLQTIYFEFFQLFMSEQKKTEFYYYISRNSTPYLNFKNRQYCKEITVPITNVTGEVLFLFHLSNYRSE